RAGGLDAGILRRERRADAWLELDHRPRLRVRVAHAFGALRQAAVRKALRARDRLRAPRISRFADDRGPVGEAGTRAQGTAWVCRSVPARRPAAATGRAVSLPRPCRDARENRFDQGRGVLS